MKLKEAEATLAEAGVPSPKHDAKELFIKIGGKSPVSLLSPDAECSSPELIKAIERRAKREPLQYIIGDVGFYRETYQVTPDVLIPRQDTELLVDYAVQKIPHGKCFLDLCTGSGCIAVSTLKNTPSTTAVAADISEEALALARQNSSLNGVGTRLRLVRADVLREKIEGRFFAILSNPPYVTEEAYASLEKEIYFEPQIAFVAEDEGLLFYKKIIEIYKGSLEDGGFFAFEIGYDQGDKITKLALSHSMSCKIIKDYSGNDRVAIIK